MVTHVKKEAPVNFLYTDMMPKTNLSSAFHDFHPLFPKHFCSFKAHKLFFQPTVELLGVFQASYLPVYSQTHKMSSR